MGNDDVDTFSENVIALASKCLDVLATDASSTSAINVLGALTPFIGAIYNARLVKVY